MREVYKMTKAELQAEAERHMRSLNERRVFGGPVSKDEWEWEVVNLRDRVSAKFNCDCGHRMIYHLGPGCMVEGCVCEKKKEDFRGTTAATPEAQKDLNAHIDSLFEGSEE